jgi:hypothetical protein
MKFLACYILDAANNKQVVSRNNANRYPSKIQYQGGLLLKVRDRVQDEVRAYAPSQIRLRLCYAACFRKTAECSLYLILQPLLGLIKHSAGCFRVRDAHNHALDTPHRPEDLAVDRVGDCLRDCDAQTTLRSPPGVPVTPHLDKRRWYRRWHPDGR